MGNHHARPPHSEDFGMRPASYSASPATCLKGLRSGMRHPWWRIFLLIWHSAAGVRRPSYPYHLSASFSSSAGLVGAHGGSRGGSWYVGDGSVAAKCPQPLWRTTI